MKRGPEALATLPGGLAEIAERAEYSSARERRRVYLRRALGFLREAREEMADGCDPRSVAHTIRVASRWARLAPAASTLPLLGIPSPRRRAQQVLTFRGEP